MKWENGRGLDMRLVADDGEILDEVRFDYGGGGYEVCSTGKAYVSQEAAQRAAERAHEPLNLSFLPVHVSGT